MKQVILTGLSILSLATPLALPATAIEQPAFDLSTGTVNKQLGTQDERERQALLDELDKMFEQHRQEMMAEMNARLDQMHEEMVRIVNERFREAAEQRLNR